MGSFEEGYQAYLMGWSINSNPYPEFDDDWIGWDFGYQTAYYDNQR